MSLSLASVVRSYSLLRMRLHSNQAKGAFDLPALRLHNKAALGGRSRHDSDDDAKPACGERGEPVRIALINQYCAQTGKSPFRFMKDVLSTVAIRDRGGTHPATLSGSQRLTSGTIAHRIYAPTNVDATDVGGKPMDIQVSTIINRPVSAVFARVADFEQWPQWEGSFVAVKRQSATPNMVGTVYWCTRKLPQVVESSFVITAYEPDQQVMIEGEWVGQFKPAGGYRLEAVADGTKVTSIGRPQLRGLFKLLTPVMAIMGTRLSKTYLSNLKRLVESR